MNFAHNRTRTAGGGLISSLGKGKPLLPSIPCRESAMCVLLPYGPSSGWFGYHEQQKPVEKPAQAARVASPDHCLAEASCHAVRVGKTR